MYGGHRDYGNADAKNKEEESKLSNSRKVINEDLDKYMNYHNPSTDCMDFSQYRYYTQCTIHYIADLECINPQLNPKI